MTATITEPGVYDLTAEAYHLDPAPVPSLSRSVAVTLVDRSPRHAWLSHPKLNPAYEPENKTAFDIGSAAHELMLRGEDSVVVIEADSYRTKAAQEARDAAYAAGRIPLLPDQHERVAAMVRACRAQLLHHEDARHAFEAGKPEQTLIWREGDVWCRAMLDWLPDSGAVFFDFKSAGQSANPDDWGRRLWDMGLDMQVAHYARGIRAVLGIENPHFRFVVVETSAPYAMSVVALDPHALNIAEARVDHAIALWRWCMKHDRWPAYPRRTCFVGVPPWIEMRWAEREMRETIAKEQGEDLKQRMIDWQAPIEMDNTLKGLTP